MKRTWVLMAALVGMLLVPACEGDPVAPIDLLGPYLLQTAHGSDLPVVVFSTEGMTIEALSGSLDLNADLTYDMVEIWQVTKPDTTYFQTLDTPGTFTVNGSKIQLQGDQNMEDRWVGSLKGETLTITGTWDNPPTQVYLKN